MNEKLENLIEFLNSKGLNELDYKPYINEIKNHLKDKKYGLVWEDKEEVVFNEMINRLPLLVDIQDRSIISDSSLPYNLIIEGDNLHSLKSLIYTHNEKIDVIYIDPPYNTGNKDFIYNDKYINKEDTWRHSQWLSFMSKRLKLAKNLLSEKGVIFISIDDHELYQLKLLCDEIFGEQNFISNIIWRKQGGGKQDCKFLANNCEYVLVYKKGKDLSHFTGKLLDESQFNKIDENGNKYRLMSLDFGSLSYSSSLDYPIYLPNGEICYPGGDEKKYFQRKNGNYQKKDWRWRCSFKEFKKRLDDGVIEFTFNKKTKKWKVQERLYFDASKQTVQENLITEFTNRTANNQIKDIFGEKIFSYPKPTNLIKHLISLHPNKNAIVLDFFAGSGTTGQSVLELNKQDGGNRQFILCTNNENNVCEKITYQRLNKIINGYTTLKNKRIEGISSNLKYYKVNLQEKDEDDDDTISNIINKCTDLISIKENCYNILRNDDYDILTNNKKTILIYKHNIPLDTDVKNISNILNEYDSDEKILYSTYTDNLNIPGITLKEFPIEIIEKIKTRGDK